MRILQISDRERRGERAGLSEEYKTLEMDTNTDIEMTPTPEDEETSQQSSPRSPSIVKEGWLMKRGEVIKNWRKR